MNRIVETQAMNPTVVLRQPPSPLQGVQLTLEIDELLATLTLQQSFRNTESQAIEVSYLCAIPLEARLLDVEVQLAGESLRGRVEARAQAEERYENALAEGQSAFCLRMVGDQLLHIALGNLLPGEELSLRLQLGWWLCADDGRVRLTLPTTLAPRYGQPDLQPHEQTHSDLLVQYPALLEGRVRGTLAAAEVSCASHGMAVRSSAGNELQLHIRNARMDRDIVLDLQRSDRRAVRASGVWTQDLHERGAAMIAFCTAQVSRRSCPVLAEFVLDCSGSMGGSSIQQSRVALRAIVEQLGAQDRLNVLRFGSQHEFMLRRPQAMTPIIRQTILHAAQTLQADLGGTELMPALHAALADLARLPADLPGERILFIVSDGEVWNPDIEQFVRNCSAQGVRVFAVAVGNAAVESTFKPMVQATGGAMERVLPADDMAQRIERHFQRVRQGAVRELSVRWPGAAGWSAVPDTVYPGDTALLLAGQIGAAASAERTAALRWQAPDGQAHELMVALATDDAEQKPSALCRMIAAARLAQMQPEHSSQWAVDYQLLTAQTGLTILKQRAAELGLDRLPELRVVPQMLAAGWGGSGQNQACAASVADSGMAIMGGAPASAPPTACAPPPPSPRSPPRGVSNPMRSMFKRAAPQADAEELECATPPARDPAVEIAHLLATHFSKQAFHVELLRQGQFTLEHLQIHLTVDQLNWLDAACEALELALDDGVFWLALATELSRLSRSLRQQLGVLPDHALCGRIAQYIAQG